MEVKQLILLHEDFLEDFGFVIDHENFHYCKKLPQSQQYIFIHLNQISDKNYLEYQLGVRLNKVESIINQFLPSLGDYKERSVTHLNSIYRINNKYPKRFLVQDEKDIISVKENVEDFFVKEGFNWMDKFSIPTILENYFNRLPEEDIPNQNFTYRSARGVTMAKLYNPSEYDNVKNFYLEKIDDLQETPFTLASLLNLLDYLDNL